jgi:hypothetical protein
VTAPHGPTVYAPTVTRRATLEWMATLSVISALPRGSWGAASAPPSPAALSAVTSQGYGTDPNLKAPVVPWSLIMEPHQLLQTAMLADLILPGVATAPAPSALGIPDFVNEWVSAPYPDQLKDRETIFEGLGWIDAESIRRSQRRFIESDEPSRRAIVDDIAQRSPQAPAAEQSAFFQRFRSLVVIAYYTTPEGFLDIGYTGNVPLAAYPPVTDEERAILDDALTKLGL